MIQGFITYDLAVSLHRKVQGIQGRASLLDQLQRAAESVVLNLAEGKGRATVKDRARFYSIALGSLREVRAALDLLLVEDEALLDQVDHIGACLYRLINPKNREGGP